MEGALLAYLLIIVVLILFSGFFSGSETALTAISRARLYTLLQDEHSGAKRVVKLRENKEALIGTILLGNNMVNIAAASLATTLAVKHFGEEYGPIYATIVMTLVVLVFAEVLPKTVAINHAERVSLLVSRPLSFFVRIFAPVTHIVQSFINGVLNMVGIDHSKNTSLISATDVIRGTIEMHHSEGEMEKEDKDMLGGILDLGEREIDEVMIHRTNVYSINLADEPGEIVDQAVSSVHSRIPLWKDDPDNIVGVLHVKDVLKLVMSRKTGITREMIRRIASKPWFVPETTLLDDQLLAFRRERKHFCCVVDEYGAWQGIVTLEDIIEEIVGDIDDEHDTLRIGDIMPFGDGYRVSGQVTIRDINRHMEWSLPDEDATTIAGLILHEAQMIPEEGAVFEFFDMRFTIQERQGNQLTWILIGPLADQQGDEGDTIA